MMAKLKHNNLLITALCSLFLYSSAYAYECEGKLFDEPSFLNEKQELSIYDKVYLMIICKNLPRGNYELSVIWENPEGKVIRMDTQTFFVDEPGDRRSSFWLKLIKKGPFERNFTNTDFDREHYGKWRVISYLQDEIIITKSFTMK